MKTKDREEREERRGGERGAVGSKEGKSTKEAHFGVGTMVVFKDVDEVDGSGLLFVCLLWGRVV